MILAPRLHEHVVADKKQDEEKGESEQHEESHQGDGGGGHRSERPKNRVEPAAGPSGPIRPEILVTHSSSGRRLDTLLAQLKLKAAAGNLTEGDLKAINALLD